MPHCRSRRCIHSGLIASARSPVIARAENWSQPIGSSTVTSYARPSAGGSVTDTSRNGTANAAAASRASPRTDRQ